MKFHLLPLGSRFELEGETYIKISPLVSERADGGQRRMIRRAAEVAVEPPQSPVDIRGGKSQEIPRDRLEQELGAFRSELLAGLQQLQPLLSPETVRLYEQMLEQAHTHLLQRLE